MQIYSHLSPSLKGSSEGGGGGRGSSSSPGTTGPPSSRGGGGGGGGGSGVSPRHPGKLSSEVLFICSLHIIHIRYRLSDFSKFSTQ